jgi:hypothetical protein
VVSVGYTEEVSARSIDDIDDIDDTADTADIDIWDTEDRQPAFQTSLSSVLESQQ